ncbi:hypothetical protein Save01_03072 [Streptomyces avermitilis]
MLPRAGRATDCYARRRRRRFGPPERALVWEGHRGGHRHHAGAVGGRSSVAAQVVEEVLDDVELPRAGRLVVDVFADGEVEYAEAER